MKVWIKMCEVKKVSEKWMNEEINREVSFWVDETIFKGTNRINHEGVAPRRVEANTKALREWVVTMSDHKSNT